MPTAQRGRGSPCFPSTPATGGRGLFRHKIEAGVYVCIDVWDSKAGWDRFRVENAEEYSQLDRDLHLLYVEELLLGYYEGEEEYRASA